MKSIFNYFLRGLLFAFPLFATFYVITVLVNWIDNSLYSLLFGWLSFEIPGLGILTAFFFIVLLGFFITKAISKPIITYSDRMFSKIPVIKIIYTAFKDLTEAFVGDKKRFNRPVIVSLVDGIDRVGFITATDLSLLKVENRVAVYCPHSYNVSGNLFLVDPTFVTPLDIDPSDAMKFAISAGVTQIDQNKSIEN